MNQHSLVIFLSWAFVPCQWTKRPLGGQGQSTAIIHPPCNRAARWGGNTESTDSRKRENNCSQAPHSHVSRYTRPRLYRTVRAVTKSLHPSKDVHENDYVHRYETQNMHADNCKVIISEGWNCFCFCLLICFMLFCIPSFLQIYYVWKKKIKAQVLMLKIIRPSRFHSCHPSVSGLVFPTGFTGQPPIRHLSRLGDQKHKGFLDTLFGNPPFSHSEFFSKPFSDTPFSELRIASGCL